MADNPVHPDQPGKSPSQSSGMVSIGRFQFSANDAGYGAGPAMDIYIDGKLCGAMDRTGMRRLEDEEREGE